MLSRRHSYLLTLGHTCVDINQGALPALLPFFVQHYDLSYAAAATLLLASSVISALVQPLFGYLGDKFNRPWLMSLGIIVAGVGIAAMGLMSSYWFILFCALLIGVGVALFHPEGAKLANAVAGSNKGAGISNFSVGGNLGFALGPVIVTFALVSWGMQGTLIFLVPTSITALILLTQTKRYQHFAREETSRLAKVDSPARKDDWVGFTKVTTVNITRAIIGNAMVGFIALYWIAVLGQSEEFSALILTVYSLAGAVATFFGGRIADRIGFKRTVLISLGLVGPLVVIFILMDNILLAGMLLMLIALAHSINYAPMIALSQAYLPNRVGFASGISLGVVVSMGGIAAPGIGALGDLWGLQASMAAIAGIAVLGFCLSLLLYTGRNAHDGVGKPTKASSSRQLSKNKGYASTQEDIRSDMPHTYK